MTKRSLYAHLATFLFWGLAATPPASAQQPAEGPACPSCVVMTIIPGQVLLLPERLHGLTILVRTSRAELDASVMQEISRRGGRPGILVVPVITSSTPDDAAFRLKSLLAEVRARAGHEGILALQVDRPEYRSLLVERHLASYADVIVGVPDAVPPARVRFWPAVHAGSARAALDVTRRGSAEGWVVSVPADVLDAVAFVAALAEAAGRPREGFSEEVEVRGARRLTVDEIVARHQASVRRQAALVTRSIATGMLTLTFEAPGFPAPVTITSDTVIYTDRERTELEQRSIRVNGIEFRGGGVPRLPILEPERVASPPLAIALTDLYRYSLAGDETVNGVRCYVVAFAPSGTRQALFRGRAWIAMDGFAMVKVAAIQTGLRGAIVSSEQVDEFRAVRDGVWMLSRSDVRQIYEGAAHRTPIHRRLSIAAHDIDPADFTARRTAAYASQSVMLRDTAEGYRYLTRERRPERPAIAGAAPVPIVPEVAQRSDRVRTLAAGVIIDPNISRPLPFAGFSYVDFNLFGTGSQLNAFFGGAYGQLAFSVPSLRGTRWQLAGRAFGIAASYNDRAFRNGRELYDEAIRQRPAHASAWLLRPLTPRVSIRVGYDLDYTRLQRAPETSSTFLVPANQVVHSARMAIEGQRAGWAGSIWWTPAKRSGWRAWGRGTEYAAEQRDFQRYGLSLSKATAVSSTIVTRLEAQAMSGRDLDRFSRYSFGTFDNRLRGYPSALVRYDRGAVLRGVVAWSASKVVRLDGFIDTAAVRDPGFGSGLRNYTGIGAAAEIPAPFGMLGSVEWGYGFRGVNADGRLGTHVIRVSAYKIF